MADGQGRPDGACTAPRCWMRHLDLALGVVTVGCVAAMMYGMFVEHLWSTRLLAMSASTAFVATGLAAGALRSWYGRSMLAGLVLCWLGDYLGPGNFMLGAAAFLIGHVMFIAAFMQRDLVPSRAKAAAIVFLPAGCALAWWLHAHVHGVEAVFVYTYMTVITAMVLCASAASRGNAWIVAGAAIFYISDIFVARWRFVTPDRLNALFCYPLYYTSCALLALSIRVKPSGRDRRDTENRVGGGEASPPSSHTTVR
ncbi:MAG TPA: lysoplasmalogenase, partial [Candidatus Hydrogenedentes bacterium]|nr:lysoplasmalogenase [Candidatus Hydrogenedentota bacterium]